MKHLTLHPAQPQDFAFCRRLYFEDVHDGIAESGSGGAQHIEHFARQWAFAAVRIIALAGADVGWLQTAPTDDATDLGQFYVARRCQRQGIGHGVLRLLIEEALRDGKAIILGVSKINPALRLYERLGFRITHEDQHQVYMRLEAKRMSA